MVERKPIKGQIFKDFRRGVSYEELYEKYDIDQKTLISILNRNVKGRYDYERILSGGLKAQKQFIAHLNSRWNPIEPGPFENISPYVAVKTPVKEPVKSPVENSGKAPGKKKE